MQYIRKIFALVMALFLIVTTIASDVVVIHALENSQTHQYAMMREKFHDMAVGGDYDINDPVVKPMLKSINDTAQKYWDHMNKNPISNAVNGSYMNDDDTALDPKLDASKDYVFPEYPLGKRRSGSSSYINANSIQFTYQYLRAMALAYETKGCALYKNQDMLKDIEMALEFMNEYHYNQKYKPASKSVPYGNWFSWRLGGPVYLGETMLLLYDDLDKEIIDKNAETMTHFVNWTSFTGANSTWNERVSMYTGLLTEQESYMKHIQSVMPTVLKYTEPGDGSFPDGYYEDGTFIQHTTFPYNGGYGLMCLTDTAYLLYMLSGTDWDLGTESAKIVYDWVLDSYEPMVYNGLSMDAFRGREITRSDTTQPRGALIIANAMLMLCENAPEDVQLQFKGCIKQWFSHDFMVEQMNESADTPWYKFPLDTVVKINEILDNQNILPVSFDGTTYQMNNGARTIHWSKEGWAYTIAMASPTIKTYEGGDSNNKGWYIGNGATYLYTNDLERTEGVEKATKDWYRIPGATSVYGRNQGSQYNQKDFAGGVTDGIYGVSGMDLSVSTHQLRAKKSWFMFDDEVVALGSDISGQYDVETTLENYRIASHNRSYAINGEEKTMMMDGEDISYQDVSTFHMNGNVEGSDIGFYFPNSFDINVKSETREGKWSSLGEYNRDTATYSADYFTAWMDHSENGNGATDGAYAYVLLPGKSVEETTEYAQHSQIDILRQDNKVHAVYEKTLGILGANFWQEGNQSIDLGHVKNYLTCDSAASVMVKDTDQGLTISVTDTTQQNDGYVTLEINREVKGVISADEGVEVIQKAPTTIIKIHVKNADGKCFQVNFSYDDVELQPVNILNAEMSQDALHVELSQAANADSYEVLYGLESGKYTKTLTSQQNTIHIYGLTPGETYYLSARARKGTEISELSQEISFTVPATTTFHEEFENFDKMLSYTSGLGFDPANGANFQGDVTRLKRTSSRTTKESIVYMLPGLQDFTLEAYGYNQLGTINFYTSVDGITWQEQVYQASDKVSTRDGWFKQLLTPVNGTNEGANYLKIEIGEHPTKNWAPQLTQFDAVMRNSSDRKMIQDTLQNDSKIYATKDVAFITNENKTLFDGDTCLVKATSQESEILYSYTNIESGTIVAYIKENGSLDVLTSSDGEEFKTVQTKQTKGESQQQGYTKVTIVIPELEEGTHYVKLKLSKETIVADTTLMYKPMNMPVQHIRFVEKTLDGVISYDVIPVLKMAPMNGEGTLTYASDDESIAQFSNGTIKFLKQGTTHVEVSVEGTDITATLPVCVYKDMCLKKTVTVSSAKSPYNASLAVDGDMDVTRWQSNTNGQEWIQVDMGESTTFDAVDIEWYSHGANYRILTSNDGENWTEIKTITNHQENGYVRYDFDSIQTARYLKIQGDSESEYSLFAVRALQKTGSEENGVWEPWNLALNKKAYCSSYDNNNATQFHEQNAVDGLITTRWASGRSDDQWYYVDLGEISKVQGVNIFWEAAAGKEYILQISDDGKTWTDMYHESHNTVTNGWKEYNFDKAFSGRYVRMQGITRLTKYGYSMYEFQVIGTNESGTTAQDIKKITFDDEHISLLKGQSMRLDMSTDPSEINSASVGWMSSQPDIVTVSSQGVIKAKGNAGSAIITVYSIKDPTVKAECLVDIVAYAGEPIKATDIKITNAIETLSSGDDYELKAQVLPENATNVYLMWASSDEAVIKVNADGKIVALQPGEATITVKTTSGLKASLHITVHQSHVEKVMDLIDEIGEVTLDSKEMIMAVRAAYDSLNDIEQTRVTNIDVLKQAENKLSQLQIEQVVTFIERLDKEIVLSDEKDIYVAKEAFDALTDEQQLKVTNVDVLHNALESLNKQKGEIAQVIAMIDVFQKEITLEDADAIQEVRALYQALNEEQKAAVDNLDVLEEAEKVLSLLQAEKENVNLVIDRISLLNHEIRLTDEQAIVEARAAYEALTNEQKAFVTNLDVLIKAEQKLSELKTHQKEDEKEDQPIIPNVPSENIQPQDRVDTSDARSWTVFLMMLLISLVTFVFVKRRKV